MRDEPKAPPALQIVRITSSLAQPLAEFFRCLQEAEIHDWFHPHRFDRDTAVHISDYSGRDLYYAVVMGDLMLGYGILRGWDEGYDIPSLGIAIRPEAQGYGLGKLLMHFLHAAARARGASRIRLKVYKDNARARALYEGLGYRFDAEDAGQMVGWKSL